MEQNKNKEAFQQLVSNQASGWLEKAHWREENQDWIDRSTQIAVLILSKLRENRKLGTSPANQKELAELMATTPQYIHKILKGKENLTLETISKLEMALGTPLIRINGYQQPVAFLQEGKSMSILQKSNVEANHIHSMANDLSSSVESAPTTLYSFSA